MNWPRSGRGYLRVKRHISERPCTPTCHLMLQVTTGTPRKHLETYWTVGVTRTIVRPCGRRLENDRKHGASLGSDIEAETLYLPNRQDHEIAFTSQIGGMNRNRNTFTSRFGGITRKRLVYLPIQEDNEIW